MRRSWGQRGIEVLEGDVGHVEKPRGCELVERKKESTW